MALPGSPTHCAGGSHETSERARTERACRNTRPEATMAHAQACRVVKRTQHQAVHHTVWCTACSDQMGRERGLGA